MFAVRPVFLSSRSCLFLSLSFLSLSLPSLLRVTVLEQKGEREGSSPSFQESLLPSLSSAQAAFCSVPCAVHSIAENYSGKKKNRRVLDSNETLSLHASVCLCLCLPFCRCRAREEIELLSFSRPRSLTVSCRISLAESDERREGEDPWDQLESFRLSSRLLNKKEAKIAP